MVLKQKRQYSYLFLTLIFLTSILGNSLCEKNHERRLTKSNRDASNPLVDIVLLVGDFFMSVVFQIWGFISSICNNCLPPPPPTPNFPAPESSGNASSRSAPGGINGIPDVVNLVVNLVTDFIPQISNVIAGLIPIPGIGLVVPNIINFIVDVLPQIIGTVINFLNGFLHLNLPGVNNVGDMVQLVIVLINRAIIDGLNGFINFFNTFIGPLINTTIPNDTSGNPLVIFNNVISTLIIEIIQALITFINPILSSATGVTLPVPDDNQKNLIVVINNLASPVIKAIIEALFNFFNSTIGVLINVTLPKLPSNIQGPIETILTSINISISEILRVLIELFNVSLGKFINLKLPKEGDNPLAIINNAFQSVLSNIFGGIITFFNDTIGKLFNIILNPKPNNILNEIGTSAKIFLTRILQTLIQFVNTFTTDYGFEFPTGGNTTDPLGVLFNATTYVVTRIWDIITNPDPIFSTNATPTSDSSEPSTTEIIGTSTIIISNETVGTTVETSRNRKLRKASKKQRVKN